MIHSVIRKMAGSDFAVEVREDRGGDSEGSKVKEETKYPDYPFDSSLYDEGFMNGLHVQRCIARKIPFTRSSSLHRILVDHGTLYADSWKSSHHLCPRDAIGEVDSAQGPFIDVHLIPLVHSQVGISRLTFVDLMEHVKIPPSFAVVLADNNGVCTAFHGEHGGNGISKSLEMYVKMPWAPALNGSLYFKHDLAASSTKMVIVFDDYIFDRLKEVFRRKSPYDSTVPMLKDPFTALTTIIAESVVLLEKQRDVLDTEVQEREASTGVTPMAWKMRTEVPIDAYPPLFDMLHLCQQDLMFMERTIDFQVQLIQFLQEQHRELTDMRLLVASSDTERSSIRSQAQKIINSFAMSASQIHHMLSQVGTLSLRIRIQLGIVESRLNQANAKTQAQMSRTQVIIAEETKRDSIAMKTIAAVTMLFLPGTFTASLFAMPFFGASDGNGQGEGFDVSQWFWLYVVITVPLTVLVLLVWLVWQRWITRARNSMSWREMDEEERKVMKDSIS